MKKIILKDGTTVEVDDKVAAHFDEVAAEVTTLKADITAKEATHKSALDKIQADADAAKADVTKITKDMADLKIQLDAASKPPTHEVMKDHIQARVNVLAVGHQVLSEDARKTLDTMDDLEIMSAVVKADDDTINLDGKSEDYIRGRFEHIAATVKDKMDTAAALGSMIITNKTDGEEVKAGVVPDENQRKLLDAWKSPVGVTKDRYKS